MSGFGGAFRAMGRPEQGDGAGPREYCRERAREVQASLPVETSETSQRSGKPAKNRKTVGERQDNRRDREDSV